MPMYQGNYVAPVWVNGVAPAINDTELLAMSGTIQASQILTGNGPPTQYTSGVAGQRYADTSTTPPTIYKLVTAAEDANVWKAETDANGNLALDYDATATYDAGDYCIHSGILYKANQDISTVEAWTAAHWTRAYLADDVAAQQVKTGSISLSSSWTGAGPYTQTVTVTGSPVTADSKVDIQLTATQIAALMEDNITAIVIENNNGTLTAWAVGGYPASSMTIQVTVTEVV